MTTLSIDTHREIASWDQEAKKEDNSKYFWETPDLDLLRSGKKSFVISRKGTGKTAIGQRLLRASATTEFAQALSFRNYPFNDLYKSLKDPSYRAHNQYISGWQFLIYCSVAKLMASDPTTDPELRTLFGRVFEIDPTETLARRFARWISGGVKFGVEGIGVVEVKLARQIMSGSHSFDDRVQALKKLIIPSLKASKYYVIFDELDEDFVGSSSQEDRKEYFALLTALFKAVELVKDDTKSKFGCVLPVVLLRDDIYKKLGDNDREKWASSSARVDWSMDKIKQLVGFRLSRAAGIEPPHSFAQVWPLMVGPALRYTVSGKQWDKFDFIGSYTLMRPRDFIFYLSQCSQKVVEKHAARRGGLELSGEILKDSVREFAQHLKAELEDEIGGQMPYIGGVLDALLGQGERDFTAAEFRALYENNRKKTHDIAWSADADSVLELLFNFSAVGYRRGKQDVFRYLSPSSDLDSNRTLLLHKGLFGARRV